MTDGSHKDPNDPLNKSTLETEPPSLEIARRRERYFHALLDNTLDIVSLLSDDIETREYVTPAVTRVLGYTPGEWMSNKPPDLLHPDDRVRVNLEMNMLRAGLVREQRSECRMLHKDGRYRWMEVLAIDMRQDPRANGILGIYRDITERRLAAEQLEHGRRILEDAQAVAKVGSWLLDAADPTVLIWSKETYRIFGIDESERITVARFFSMVHPDDVALVERESRIFVEPYSLEHRIVRLDGETLWVHESARVEFDANTGDPLRTVGTVQDITERKRTEEQLRHSQKMEAIGRLAGGVAHDFNNLLALILAQTEWVQHHLGSAHPLQTELAEIVGASARGAALTRQLLAFGRRQRTSARLLRLDVVVSETERLLRRLLGEHIAIEVTLAGKGDAVLADRGNLEQVLINLALNARDAMPKGGTLRIATRREEVTKPRLLPTGQLAVGMYAVLSVADEGSGIEPRVRPHLFEPFFTTKALGEGTGLGLATVFGIVQEAAGGIDLQSELGAGTTFDVLLPVAVQMGDQEEPDDRTTERDLPRGNETLLLVEDDASLRGVLRRTLASLGYAVLAAADGAEAMKVCTATRAPIDLLLTDLVMPGRDGRATAEMVTRERPAMKTLFMSGYAEPEVMAGDSDGRTVLAKPFTAHELAVAIRKALTT